MKKLLILILSVSLLLSITAAAWAQKPSKSVAPSNSKIIVYYFYNNYRCPTCKKLEAYTSETLTSKFADAMKKGLITWQMVNVDQPANKHFIKEYKIFTKQVVLVETKNGAQTRWKNLDKIWNLHSDKAKFSAYIENEIKAFKGGS
ncbi:MAG: nitrophenyl compound nitroreductase subunit ArsF family protein [Candidatus Eremiobacteraeota bacterium]|nr:nitrophenyl compound nitroreductase subunit ArsF family protein [Candidatus Eremiobacteraeota bacterium]